MFVIGVTRATGKLLVTSVFKGVGTVSQGEREIPSVERNNGINVAPMKSWERPEMRIRRSHVGGCSPAADVCSAEQGLQLHDIIAAITKVSSLGRVVSQLSPTEIPRAH